MPNQVITKAGQQGTVHSATLNRCYAAFFLSGMGSMMVGSLLPMLRDSYGLSYEFCGMLLSAQPVGNLVSTLLAGVLPMLIGRRRGTIALVIWMPVAYLLFSFVSLPALLLAAFFLTGIGRGGGTNFLNVTVTTLAGETPRAMNLLHASFALGAFLAPFLVLLPAMLPGSGGFCAGAMLMAALALLQLTVYLRLTKNALPEPQRAGALNGRFLFLRSKSFWIAGLVLLSYLSAEYAITGWLVTYMGDSGIFSPQLSQMMSSLLWIDMLLGRVLVAALSKRVKKSLMLMCSGAGFLVSFIIVFTSTGPLQATIGIALLGFSMAGIYPTTFSCVSAEISGNDFAASMLIVMGSIGGIATPALIGAISENAGIVYGMRTVVVLSAVTFILLLISARHQRRLEKIRA